MQLRVTRDAGGRPRLELRDAPPSVTALEAAPPRLEPELAHGAWLVMLVPTWSAPDLAAVVRVAGVAEHFGGAVRFGVRPFEDFEETTSWVSGLDWGPTPVWLAYRDGELREVRRGLLDAGALTAFVDDVLIG